MVTPIKANVTPTCMRFSSVVFSFDFICSFCSCFSYDNYIRIPQRRKFQSQCQNTLPPDEMEAFQRHTNPPTQDNVGRTAGSEEEILLKRIDATDQEATEDEKNKEESKEESGELKKDISLLSMIAFVVGLIIGSGIFITPTNVLKNSGSFGMALIVWIVGAFLAVGGGLCYCELGLLMKNSGGEYWYLKETYNFGRPDKVCGYELRLCSSNISLPLSLSFLSPYLPQLFHLFSCGRLSLFSSLPLWQSLHSHLAATSLEPCLSVVRPHKCL